MTNNVTMTVDDCIFAVKNNEKNFICDMATFHLSDKGFVRFTISAFTGMVGESMEVYEAEMFWLNSEKDWKVTPLKYEDLKKIYKLIDGKTVRIEFWRWMKQFSPAMVNERFEIERADAIRRVI